MATIHWLSDDGEAEPQSVCTVDASDRDAAVAFAFDLYTAVHGFARQKRGFAIKGKQGETLHQWSLDGAQPNLDPDGVPVSGAHEPAVASANPVVPRLAERPMAQLMRRVVSFASQREKRLRALWEQFLGAGASGEGLIALHRLERGLRATRGIISRKVALMAVFARRLPREPAEARRFAPDILLSVRKWPLTIDHYVLAGTIGLVILCGSPLYSIYSTVSGLQNGDAAEIQDLTRLVAKRGAASSALTTGGAVDFRKMFWHLRVIGPTEIHLLAYEPAFGANGPMMIFKTHNLLHWQLAGVRDGSGIEFSSALSGASFAEKNSSSKVTFSSREKVTFAKSL